MKELLKRFDKHLELLDGKSQVYSGDFYYLQTEQKSSKEALLTGKISRDDFLATFQEFDRAFMQERMFLVSTPAELEEVLYEYTLNAVYAAEAREYHERFAQLIESFQPVYENEPKPSTIYGVFIADDPGIIPYTLACVDHPDPVQAYTEDRYKLFKSWSLSTIKEYILYLQSIEDSN